MINTAKGAMEQKKGSKKDLALWILIAILLAGGIVAYYYFAEIAWSLRAAAGLVLICIILAIGLQTHQGKQIWIFAKAARGELRKVVWPTRQETIQTTLIVVAMIIIVALILWGIDSILMWLVSWFSGPRG